MIILSSTNILLKRDFYVYIIMCVCSYESEFAESFWFERHQHSSHDILPLTWVWGIKPKDARDFLDPMARPNASELLYDNSFDITKPKAQVCSMCLFNWGYQGFFICL